MNLIGDTIIFIIINQLTSKTIRNGQRYGNVAFCIHRVNT